MPNGNYILINKILNYGSLSYYAFDKDGKCLNWFNNERYYTCNYHIHDLIRENIKKPIWRSKITLPELLYCKHRKMIWQLIAEDKWCIRYYNGYTMCDYIKYIFDTNEYSSSFSNGSLPI